MQAHKQIRAAPVGRGADLFVSLHFNASPSDTKNVEGLETYCITPVGAASSNAQGEGSNYGATMANRFEYQSLLLAYQMEKSLVRNLGVEDRSVRRARYAVLRDAEMPAILIEGGYMTHPAEGKKIFDAAYRKQMAAAMVKGIISYQKLTAPAAPPAVAYHSTPRPAGGRPVNRELRMTNEETTGWNRNHDGTVSSFLILSSAFEICKPVRAGILVAHDITK